MPFAMCSHQNALFSVGDDRSLRVWSIENGEQVPRINFEFEYFYFKIQFNFIIKMGNNKKN